MLFLSVMAGQALALDPAQSLNSYLRTRFTKEDGLPSGVVNVILQTRNGFLWVGTDGGLARFDGTHFTTIEFSRQTPTEGLSRALAEGPDGDLWVGTNTGVLRIPSTALDQFGPLPSTIYHPGSGASDSINALTVGRDGTVWAGTDGGIYRFGRGAFSTVLPNVSVSRIEESLSGHLLIVTSERFLEWDGKVGVMGFCLGGLMAFLTAARETIDAAVAYRGGETENISAKPAKLQRPC
jgi:ligand-binding sensor domain-containing protein